MRKRLIGVLAVAVLLCAAAGLSAQIAPTSDTSGSTAGIFKTNTDYFMSVVDYTAITQLQAFLGMTTANLQVGYGQLLGPGFYLAGYYNGNALNVNNSSNANTTQVNTQYLLNNNVIVGSQVITTVSGQVTNSSTNNAAVLLGVAGIGIEVGVNQSASVTSARYRVDNITVNPTSTNPDTLNTVNPGGSDSTTAVYGADLTTLLSNTVTTFTNGVSNINQLQPVLSVGTKLNLGGMTLKPQLTANINFQQTNLTQSYLNYTQNIGSGFPTYPAANGITEIQSYTTTDYAQAQSYTRLDLIGGATMDLPGANNSVSTIGLSYEFNSPLYANSYTDLAGTTQNVAGTAFTLHRVTYGYIPTASTLTDLRAYQTIALSQATHTVMPSFKYVAPVTDQLSLGAQASASFALFNSSQATSSALTQVATTTSNVDPLTSSTETINKTVSGNTVATSTLTVTPSLALGLQYVAVPKFMTINLGGSVSLPKFVNSSTTTTNSGINTVTDVATNGAGQITTNTYASTLGTARTETQATYGDINGMSTAVSGGVSLAVADGMVLDLQLQNTVPLVGTGFVVGTSQTLSPVFVIQFSISK